MPISSISSIAFLNLWLDGTDLSTMTINPLLFNTSSVLDLYQWNDKSSNAYQFVPVRSADKPKVSTNRLSSVAVLFDQVSSFQLLSLTKAPANSTVDFFAVLTPYSLWGPRQPLFDSADMTVSETDYRFNTQIYADGNDFFRQTPAMGSNCGAAIYKGNLYIGTNSALTSNYLQKYNKFTRSFEYLGIPMACNWTHSLAVYNGSIYVAGGSNSPNTINYGGSGGFGTGFLEFWNGSDKTFKSTVTIMSTFGGPLCVHQRELYATTWNGWAATYINNNTQTLATQPRPQLYKLNTLNISTLTFVTELQGTNFQSNIHTNDYSVYLCNVISYRGDLWINAGCNTSYGRALTRLSGASGFYNSNYIYNNTHGYISVYWGSLIVPITNEYRMFKWNENAFLNFGRFGINTCNSDNMGRQWQPSGGMVSYKGLLHTAYGGSNGNGAYPTGLSNNGGNWQSNYVNFFVGEHGATYSNSSNFQLTTNGTGTNQSNLMIVHDGKLFLQNGYLNTSVIEYGNGTTTDQSFSSFTGSPIILQIRKSPTACQTYLNGTLVDTQSVNFTYSNQNARELWVGGAAGMLASGQSDSGSDHFQGAIHTIAQYSSNLNTSDRQKVEGILAWTYGIQNVLPASHPYRNSNP
jgi:hypothetical protein